jgi:hypothetical protein
MIRSSFAAGHIGRKVHHRGNFKALTVTAAYTTGRIDRYEPPNPDYNGTSICEKRE